MPTDCIDRKRGGKKSFIYSRLYRIQTSDIYKEDQEDHEFDVSRRGLSVNGRGIILRVWALMLQHSRSYMVILEIQDHESDYEPK